MVKALLLTSVLVACASSDPQPQYAQQPYPQQQQAYPQQQPYQQQPYQQQPYPQQQPQQPVTAARRITINGMPASARDLQTIEALERQWGIRAQDGDYWYDNTTGATGLWGGPMVSLLPAGLALGGPMPAHASGGGNGALTGVFVNGRELHPYDVTRLQQLVGQVYQGRWWVDAQGNFGQEGGAMLGNLYALQQKRSGGAKDSYWKKDDNGSVFVGGGCVRLSNKNVDYMGGC
ncbi:MAG TPA: hypothetical protein VMZ53_11240 [Kofleriaceae bacterium]|nr:hypothetical protein [Kofleriaceae bacterium]